MLTCIHSILVVILVITWSGPINTQNRSMRKFSLTITRIRDTRWIRERIHVVDVATPIVFFQTKRPWVRVPRNVWILGIYKIGEAILGSVFRFALILGRLQHGCTGSGYEFSRRRFLGHGFVNGAILRHVGQMCVNLSVFLRCGRSWV